MEARKVISMQIYLDDGETPTEFSFSGSYESSTEAAKAGIRYLETFIREHAKTSLWNLPTTGVPYSYGGTDDE